MRIKHLSILFLFCCTTANAETNITTSNKLCIDIYKSVKSDLIHNSQTPTQPQTPNYIYADPYISICDLKQILNQKSEIIRFSEIAQFLKLDSGDYCNRVLLDDFDDCSFSKQTYYQNFSKILHADACKGLSYFKTSI